MVNSHEAKSQLTWWTSIKTTQFYMDFPTKNMKTSSLVRLVRHLGDFPAFC